MLRTNRGKAVTISVPRAGVLGFLIAALPVLAGAVDPDEAFDRGEYAAALAGYEAMLQDPSQDTRLLALYRAAESEALLFRWGSAAQRVFGAELPGDPVWRARFLILRAELGREFLKQYGFAAPTDVEEGAKDLAKLTPAEWHARVLACYKELWSLRGALMAVPINGQSWFIDLKDAAVEGVPTLWDFAVLRLSGYLLDEAPTAGPLPQASDFLGEEFAGSLAWEGPPAAAAGAVLQEASDRALPRGSAASTLRQDAADLWKVKRLMIPFRHPDRVAHGSDRKAELQSGIMLLRRWHETLSPGAAAQAGLEAGRLYEELGQPDQAVLLYKSVESRRPGTYAAKAAAKQRAGIELPELHLSAKSVPPPGSGSLTILSRNLERVYLRLYQVRPGELKSLKTDRWSQGWGALRRPGNELIESLLTRPPHSGWSAAIRPARPHARADTKTVPPALTPGLYVAVASSDDEFKPGASMLSAAVLNVTELFLVATAGPSGPEREFIFDPARASTRTTAGYHLYAMDALTGAPRPASVDAFFQERWSDWKTLSLRLDDAGRGSVPVNLKLTREESNNFSLDPLATLQGSHAFLPHPIGLHYSAPAPIEVHLETDRPVYRPGQEAAVKATVLVRLPRGYKVYDGSAPLTLRASDPNGQEFFKTSLKLNAMGSASARFALPTGRLLGRYGVTADINGFGQSFRGWAALSVEEYKRPEFELTVDESSGPAKYGAPATVSGGAKYYFGGPVQAAVVEYKVYREPFFLPWFWWRREPGRRIRTLVHSGRAETDAAGRFSLTFVPAPEEAREDPMPSIFTVEVDARDAGGRTIDASRSFRAGAKACLFSLTPSAGFFTPDAPARVDARLLNLDENPLAGEGSFTLHRLEGAPELPVRDPDAWQGTNNPVRLEEAFKAVPNGPLVREGRVAFALDKPARLDLGRLETGVYRLTMSGRDPWGGRVEQSVVLVSAGQDSSSLGLPPVALAERADYRPGDKARFLVGSSRLKGGAFLEVWAGPFLQESRTLAKAGPQVVAVEVKADHRGGLTARWFGASDFKLDGAEASVAVPWKDKDLGVKIELAKSLRPGQRAAGTLRVAGPDGRPVSGEASLRIFDRSLEYYMTAARPWVSDLYPAHGPPASGQDSLFAPDTVDLPVTAGWLEAMLKALREFIAEPALPMLRLNKVRLYRRGRLGREKMAVMADSADSKEADASNYVLPGAPAPKTLREEEAKGGVSAKAKKDGGEPEVKARSDFSETALFEPHLKAAEGRAPFAFKAPERLTAWKAQASVITGDVKRGAAEALTVTRKDLMVRLELPRFLREGDQGTLKAVIHNETKDEVSGTARLSVSEDGAPAEVRLGLSPDALSRPFAVKPFASQALSWPVKVAPGRASLKVKASARVENPALERGGKFVGPGLSDAEEKDLPILPSRTRLIETAFATLDGTTRKDIAIPAFREADPTRINESVTLQVEPQLALSIINSLPFLVHYPFECVEQTLNRFVPLGIVNSFYGRHPGLAEAVKSIPKRGTAAPAWDRSDPRRLAELMETPWAVVSQGRRPPWPLVDLFDASLVKREMEDARDKLVKAQNPDGSFPWFPGGRPDPYITLLVLEGLAQALDYGVDIPRDCASRAIAYVRSEMPRRLKDSLKPDEGSLAMLLYAAYVLTSFDRTFGNAEDLRALARAWADAADKHAAALTPLGKAYAAQVYRRLGDKAKADLYLDRAMDGAREDPLAGVYWTPEKISWLWYNDSVEKHAFMLRTLLAVSPKDPRIPGMVRWLLFNRTGNEWKSTKASAAAIYSLLDVLKVRGSLDKGDSFVVRWGPDVRVAAVGPLDWLKEPLRWTKLGADVGPGHGSASLSKEGPGLGFASLAWIYTTDKPAQASGPGLLTLERRFFKRVREGSGFKLVPLASGDTVSVGEQIEVRLTVEARSQFEYLHLKDPKLAGLEAEGLLSGWKWSPVPRYEEPRDSLTNFFLDWAPHGEFSLSYRLRPAAAGTYRAGPAVLQSMYAPEMAAHSAGFELRVEE